MGVTFYGNGAVFIPESRSFVYFVDGKYTTDKVREISVLAPQFKHDMPVHDSIKDCEVVEIADPEGTDPEGIDPEATPKEPRKYTKRAPKMNEGDHE